MSQLSHRVTVVSLLPSHSMDALTYAGINRTEFDNKAVTFEEHLKKEHNMWDYLKFIVLLKVKDPTEFTGPESYVYHKIQVCRGGEG